MEFRGRANALGRSGGRRQHEGHAAAVEDGVSSVVKSGHKLRRSEHYNRKTAIKNTQQPQHVEFHVCVCETAEMRGVNLSGRRGANARRLGRRRGGGS